MKKNQQTRKRKREFMGAMIAMVLAESSASGSIRFAAGCEINAEAAADGQTQRAATVSVLAYNGGQLRVAGYSAPVVIDLDGISGLGKSIPLLRDHDTKRVIGYVTATRKGNAIEAAGRLTGNSPDRQEVAEQAADGFPWQASVGVRPTELAFVKGGQSVEVNGRKITGPVYVAKAARLAELTITAIGADAETQVAVAAELDGGQNDESQQTGASTGTIASIREERARRDAIEAVAVAQIKSGGDVNAIESAMVSAIAAGETAQQFELTLLREHARPSGRFATGQQVPAERLGRAIEAAVMVSLGWTASQLESEYSEPTLNAMDKDSRLKHGLSLQDVLLYCAEQNGRRDISRRDIRGMLQGAFADVNASGISTISVSGILSNVANKQLKMAFDSVADLFGARGEKMQAYRVLGAVGSVSDFKQRTAYSLTGDLTYDKLAPGGEIKHGTLGEESYTNQADTYAKMLGIDRRDIINDDLNALSAAPRKLGRGAANKIASVFWTAFLDNASFFTSGRGNYDDGSDTAFSLAAITLAERLFMDQTDPDGLPLGVMASLLLTATKYHTAATNAMNSLRVNNGASGDNPSDNPHAGKFRNYTSPYLSNANYTGYSTEAWYLLADPADLPVIETVFLNGRQQPTVETTEADFQQLGVQMRGYHDFGCAKQEYRAGVKMKGEA